MCVFAFDLLFLNGQPLLQEPLRERRALLTQALPNIQHGVVELAQGVVLEHPVLGGGGGGNGGGGGGGGNGGRNGLSTATAADAGAVYTTPSPPPPPPPPPPAAASQHEMLEEHLLGALAAGAEGLMLKRMDERSSYEPSKRSDTYVGGGERDLC